MSLISKQWRDHVCQAGKGLCYQEKLLDCGTPDIIMALSAVEDSLIFGLKHF